MSLLVIPVLVAACTGAPAPTPVETDPSATTPAPVDTGSTVPPYVAEEPVPDLELADLTHAIVGVYGASTPNGRTLRDTYLGMMAMGDERCPASTTNITQDFVLGCTADSGYYYSGVCNYSATEVIDGTGTEVATWGFGGDFELAYPDGAYFSAGGGVTWEGRRTPDGAETFTSNIRGTWRDESQNNWLGAGFSTLVDIHGGTTADGGNHVTVDGGIAIGDTDLYFEEFTWDWSGDCAGTPTGALWVRDTRGYWYVWTLTDDCTGCGEVVFHDAISLGELCLDLVPVGEAVFYSNTWEP